MSKVTDLLSREEIRQLRRASNWRGAWSVTFSWGLIFAAMALVVWLPSVATVLAALVIIGGRQLGLAVLTHETAHYSLFASKPANQIIGRWLCGAPMWVHVDDYRTHHIGHHTRTGTDDDPDLGLIRPFPTSAKSLARKFARDLTGITAAKRVFGLSLMDSGRMKYTASVDLTWLDRRSLASHAVQWIRTAWPVVLTNAALLGLLTLVGHPLLYLLWVGAWCTTYSAILRIRSIAEHACTERTDDQLRNTRTTHANVLARLLWAPHHVNYHLEHHLLMTVPHYNLAAMHAMLRERGVFDDNNYAAGYFTVLQRAVTPR